VTVRVFHDSRDACLGDKPSCEYLDNGSTSYTERAIGVDETNGRYGLVDARTCRSCGRLRYHVEYEGFTGSGRWFRGLLPEDVPRGVAVVHLRPVVRLWRHRQGQGTGLGCSVAAVAHRAACCGI
jgi:hypothetical protein